QCLATLESILVPAPVLLRLLVATAENRVEVVHEVLDVPAAVLADENVLRVAAARVVVIEPGREHTRASQFATVLVREDVVRIVGPRAVVPEAADDLGTRGIAAQHGAIPSVG